MNWNKGVQIWGCWIWMMPLNICGSLVWNLLRVRFLELWILWWLLYFRKIWVPLNWLLIMWQDIWIYGRFLLLYFWLSLFTKLFCTGWTVRDRIPVGTRFSAPVQTGPGAHPASCKMGTGVFPGGKVLPGRAADHSPPSSAAVMEE